MVPLCPAGVARGGQPPAKPCVPAGAPAAGLMLGAAREETGVWGESDPGIPWLRWSHQSRSRGQSTHRWQGLSHQTQPCSSIGHLPGMVVRPDPTSGFSTGRTPVPSPPAPTDTPVPSPRCRCRPARHCSASRSAAGAAPGLCPQSDTEQNKSKFPGS